jgi:hypothetical protein
VHPPLFTKVMGMSKNNIIKASEEKMKKDITIFTKSGVTIHCSVCGIGGHNKKGHDKFMNTQMQQQHQETNGRRKILIYHQ